MNNYYRNDLAKIVRLGVFIILLANLANNNILAKSVKEIRTVKEYHNAVKSNTPAVFMYCSNHCAPCRTMKPHFMQVAREFPNVAFYMVNTSISALGSLIGANNIMGLPTITYVLNGQEVRRDRKGAMPPHEIRQSVKAAFNNNNKNQNKNIQNNLSKKNSQTIMPQAKSTNNTKAPTTQQKKTKSNEWQAPQSRQVKLADKTSEIKMETKKTETSYTETKNLNNNQIKNATKKEAHPALDNKVDKSKQAKK